MESKVVQTHQDRSWGKLLVYCAAVIAPAVIIAGSTYSALPDSFWIILGMLIISVTIAGIFMYYSSDATAKVRRYCIIAAIVVGLITSLGLILHVLLSREISIATQDVSEAAAEQSRQDERFKQNAEITRQLEESRKSVLRAEAIRNDSLRRLGGKPPAGSSGPNLTIPAPPVASMGSAAPVQIVTPIQIRHKYSGWLIASAIADVLASVVAALVLAARWEWDRDGDGIPDHLQRPGGSIPNV